MVHILIAWELGEAYGHLARCLQLAEGLVSRGYKVTLVLKDTQLPARYCGADAFTVLPTPLSLHAGGRSFFPVNYAEVLIASGFANAQDVATRLKAWCEIFSSTSPDVLVADHAPTALLAARLADIPSLSIGNGFAIPPTVSPWPSIRPREVVAEHVLLAAEERLNKVLTSAQQVLGHKKLVSMRDLFGANDILDTFAELDHYRERSQGRYVGPIASMPQALRIAWQSCGTIKVLAYLRPAISGFNVIMQALAQLDAEVLCITPGLIPDVAKRYATHRLRIVLAPIDLLPLLEHADLSFSYGNSGFSTQALLAGVPLAMRPRYVEQALFAYQVEALGAGKLLAGRIDVNSVTTSLHELLANSSYRRSAYTFREKFRNFSQAQALEHSLCLIEQVFLNGSCE